MAPTEVTFGLSPSYGIHTARDAHEWFLEMVRAHEEFEVETDQPGEWAMPFWSESYRRTSRRARWVRWSSGSGRERFGSIRWSAS